MYKIKPTKTMNELSDYEWLWMTMNDCPSDGSQQIYEMQNSSNHLAQIHMTVFNERAVAA